MRAGTTPNGQPRSTALYEAILRLDNLDDCIRFFEDLCAVTELRTMEQDRKSTRLNSSHIL